MDDDSLTKVQIILIGDTQTGKSTLIEVFTSPTPIAPSTKYDFTAGTPITITGPITVKGKEVKFLLVDTAGRERFRPMSEPSSYEKFKAVICVYSVTSRPSLDLSRTLIGKVRANKLPDQSAIVLIGTHIDIEGDRKVSSEEGASLAADLNVDFLEISSFDKKKVTDMFHNIALKAANSFTEK